MNATALPAIAELERELASLQLPIEPSEVHGAMVGYHCAGGRLDATGWLAQLHWEAGNGSACPAAGALQTLRETSRTQLADDDFGLELLLPVDSAAVVLRAEALSAWCRGFLGGFGLALPAGRSLGEDAQEALEDLGRLAAVQPEASDDEDDEAALAELIEFVRIAALLLCAEARGARLH